ncbi:EamA family transporter [Erythrobacter sp. 3-20A1M]|uniref:DMT family transporter n=1 Tax=Erythrobacter sp. 3-20A1M TaxID=2653850 RepID=UPI001BFCAB3C|nr:DMT family transporter [Erythrobacter sp. 3-20A1M]QWC55968.1 EamA family transporter [Erythrobacter sp. 3-20A1M]
MSFRTIALLFLVNLIWAANVVVSKLAVGDLGIPPLFYALLRSVIVVAALAPLLRPVPQGLLRVMLVGLAISGGSFALLFVGLKTASPSAAGIVSLSGAPLTVLFAILILKERVRWRRAGGIVLAFVGVGIAVASPAGWASGSGLGWVGLSAIVGALGSVFVKRIEIDSVRLQAWAAVASTIVLTPLSLATESGQFASIFAHPWEATACLIYAALVTSVGAHSLYYRLLQHNEANMIVPFTLLCPLMTVGLGASITGDAIGWPLVIGGIIAVAGVAVIVLRPSQVMPKQFLVRPRL